MPKVAQEVLDGFGRAVKRARALRGWTLDELASHIIPAPGKSFLSNIEKGQRQISATTVGKLIGALNLEEVWIDRFLDADITPETEETRTDRETERLLHLYEKDDSAPRTGEVLLLMLAEEWAQKSFTDPTTAYTALRGALQAAADIEARGALPSNASDQLQAVLRRVAELNNQGELEAADAALQDASERNAAEAEALFEAHLNQDRLRNRPGAAAQRLVARLKASAPPGGVFWATVDLLVEWSERGERLGDLFDLAVALELARLNHARAKGPQAGQALLSLGNCHRGLGERQSGGEHLQRAVTAYRLTLNETPRKSEPENWATAQNNLGNALRNLGERDGDSARLIAAVTAFEAALTVRTAEAAPMDWAMTQNNLGTALSRLGEREKDSAHLCAAVAVFEAALTVRTKDATPMDWAVTQNNLGLALRWLGMVGQQPQQFDKAERAFADCLSVWTREDVPFPWATVQWNLADLALARHALSPDPALLPVAQGYLDQARGVFAAEENAHQLAECDRLQALIDAG